MTVAISRAVHDAILASAAADPSCEVCGLLFGTRDRIVAMTPACNVAAEPSQSFEIDPAALIGAHRAERRGGPRVAGYFHSHPNGLATPSARDAASAVPDGRLWLIVARGALSAWTAEPGGFAEIACKLDG